MALVSNPHSADSPRRPWLGGIAGLLAGGVILYFWPQWNRTWLSLVPAPVSVYTRFLGVTLEDVPLVTYCHQALLGFLMVLLAPGYGKSTLAAWMMHNPASSRRWPGEVFRAWVTKFGLPYPKGVLIVGIQGTGKSLCAKAISQQWHMPLLRLDVGRLMGSYVGESEARTREMIQIAEAMAPCVLWIDEVDKGFAGIGGVQGDSGAQARVFGSLITWMQEKKSPVFIVATANNIEQLPPEFMRKGRFDEIFFVNLPTEKERVEIFRLHISRRRDIAVKNYDLAALAKETKGFSGAEIEQVINDAMFQAFSQQRDFTTEDILAAIHSTIPLSVSFRETINKLIAWAGSGRARMASSQQEANESAAGDQLYYSYQNGTGDGIQ